MISQSHNQRPSEWRKLFGVAVELLDQVKAQLGGHEFQWSSGRDGNDASDRVSGAHNIENHNDCGFLCFLYITEKRSLTHANQNDFFSRVCPPFWPLP